ncbi:hypothetical protein [Chondromyces crocatus]|uniref:Uncharacterized protein n=1 Tax=Chondromyces crocatus TaxID=52 RepID=A0A0K1EN52_CHOCO|nr:hypothetical protein [Chondromyces crocatus]AKT42266.1 uncharacterized protein CMC5_064890 [Chondromyces crocatus]
MRERLCWSQGIGGTMVGIALLMVSGSAVAEGDGAAFFVLPVDRAWLQTALREDASARAEARAVAVEEDADAGREPTEPPRARPAHQLLAQLRNLAPTLQNLRDLGVMPLWLGFNGFGLRVRGKMD